MKADASDDSENNEKDAEGIDADSTVTSMGLSQRKSRLSIPRILLFSLSVVSLVLCALGATAHYLKWAWENPWQLVGWLLSMLFLLLAFSPPPREIAAGLKYAAMLGRTAALPVYCQFLKRPGPLHRIAPKSFLIAACLRG